ncbi:twin-arginine translocase subunit TatC [Acinetobacter sp. C32I]|uniref:twin-arginine translocase subunit TatC n=1 Tax=Acinetobacter sp. C32I TaxID=2950074 RepID=UPI002036B02B|nr:twin-arginine translocase subunit TatC [Acinetobacter sp. C32I]USA55364.1 twin-arginine translocase subunit TatC [Acinetobacter sp. C32I]
MNDREYITSSLAKNLYEIRKLTIKIVIMILLAFISLLPFAKNTYQLLSAPLQMQLPPNSTMIATDIASNFMSPFKLNFYLTLMLIMPFSLLEVWKFIAPALYKNEKQLISKLLILSFILFYCGIAFSYQLILPSILHFFIYIAPDNILPMTDINSYLSFCLKLFLVFGLAFEIPVLVIVLVLTGMVPIENLKSNRRYIIVGCFGIAMFVTPPDALRMALLAIPMYILFELGLFLCNFLKAHEKQYIS